MAGMNGAGPGSLDLTDWGTRRGGWRPPGRVGRRRCATLRHGRERRRRPRTRRETRQAGGRVPVWLGQRAGWFRKRCPAQCLAGPWTAAQRPLKFGCVCADKFPSRIVLRLASSVRWPPADSRVVLPMEPGKTGRKQTAQRMTLPRRSSVAATEASTARVSRRIQSGG